MLNNLGVLAGPSATCIAAVITFAITTSAAAAKAAAMSCHLCCCCQTCHHLCYCHVCCCVLLPCLLLCVLLLSGLLLPVLLVHATSVATCANDVGADATCDVAARPRAPVPPVLLPPMLLLQCPPVPLLPHLCPTESKRVPY